jgi:hypothetical protein
LRSKIELYCGDMATLSVTEKGYHEGSLFLLIHKVEQRERRITDLIWAASRWLALKEDRVVTLGSSLSCEETVYLVGVVAFATVV